MAKHPKQMIMELTDGLNPTIINFFEENKEHFSVNNLSQIVEDLLITYYESMDSISIKDTAEKLRRKLNKTKARWYKSYQENMELYPDVSMPKNIYNIFYKQKMFLSQKAWESIYGNVSVNQLVEQKDEQIHAWKNKRNSRLIEYPMVKLKRFDFVYSALCLDIALDIYNTIKKDYGGSLNRFFRSYPQELVNKPLFSPNSYDVTLSEYAGQFVENFFPSGNGNPLLRMVSTNGANVMRVFDSDDLSILSMFLSNIDTSFYSTRRVTIPLADVAKVLYRGKLSERSYEEARKRCLDFNGREYKYTNSNTKESFAFNYFDSVYVSPANHERRVVILTFGDLLYRAITDGKLISVTSRNFEALENSLSKIIYYLLQRERVNLGLKSSNCSIPIVGEYDYTFFQQCVRFHTSKKRSNIKLLNTALDEFVRKKIAIKSYTSTPEGHFSINYIPLSEAEYSDLQFVPKKNLIVDES